MSYRICLLEQAAQRSAGSVVPRLVDRLRAQGCEVTVWVPECQPAELRNVVPDADLYLWKSHGPLCDSIAAYLAAAGRPILNDYFATLQVRDKLVTSQRLIDAGLPTPDAVFADDLEQLAQAIDRYPVVVKPNGGRRGQQVSLAENADDLLRLKDLTGPLCAQQYIAGNGIDLKVYGIGPQVFAVSRPSPLDPNGGQDRELRHLSAEIEQISLRCGEAFGLELYGVDLIETPDGLSVIEVNCFPGYKGVPGADRLLADYIVTRARIRHSERPSLSPAGPRRLAKQSRMGRTAGLALRSSPPKKGAARASKA
jgi:ribosomal protein S6--L-glutamate ligase